MKTKSIYSISILILTVLFIGCNDEEFFELQAPKATQWENIEDMEKGVTSMYDEFIGGGDGKFEPWFHAPQIHFAMSDLCRQIGVQTSGTLNMYNRETQNNRWYNGNANIFKEAYKTIKHANYLLDVIATDPYKDLRQSEVANLNRIKGERSD